MEAGLRKCHSVMLYYNITEVQPASRAYLRGKKTFYEGNWPLGRTAASAFAPQNRKTKSNKKATGGSCRPFHRSFAKTLSRVKPWRTAPRHSPSSPDDR